MKVISIGNSFSQDAQRWLHDIAVADGFSLDCANIFVHDAQTLEYQWDDMKALRHDNAYEVNGAPCKENVAIEDALTCKRWDVVTLQQVSNSSGRPQSYVPYIQSIARRVTELLPDAKLYIHRTWSYEYGVQSESFSQYNSDSGEMYRRIGDAAETAALLTGAGLIPAGDVIQRLRDETAEFDYRAGGLSLCRDGRHLSESYGRFAAGAAWYETLTGRDVRRSGFAPLSCDPALLRVIREKAHEVCAVRRIPGGQEGAAQP